MAPEKLLLSKNEKRKYDPKCEIYSVGMLLREIAELKKPHSDLDKLELHDIVIGIRKRIQDKHYEPFSDDVPLDWQLTVSKAFDYEPRWRPNMSDICRDFYKLSENYSKSKPSLINIKMSASAEDANAMYIVGKAYWEGGNGIEQDKEKVIYKCNQIMSYHHALAALAALVLDR
ncbi:unnamed protein product [Rhizophagus irregularis]|nr:unnamed protein product [Rhizophagus irregularis]